MLLSEKAKDKRIFIHKYICIYIIYIYMYVYGNKGK